MRRRRRNPVNVNLTSLLVLAGVGIAAYLLYKSAASVKAAVCSVKLPAWMGGSGESVLCQTVNPDGSITPSALNTPASVFDSSGNAITPPVVGTGANVGTPPDIFATDPYTTFGVGA